MNYYMQAGPGTIAEAMIRGLPIILNGYIAGQVTKARRPFTRLISITKKKKNNDTVGLCLQEAGNVPYVVQNGCGKFSKSPKQIAKIVSEWFGPRQDELFAMSENALRFARPDAVFKIVHDLHNLVTERSLQTQTCTA